MTAPVPVTPPGARGATFANTPDVFVDIYQGNINMAVWQRTPAAALLADCQMLLNRERKIGHRLIVPTAKLDNLSAVLSELGDYPHLLADIQLLGEMFSCLFELSAIGLRLATLTQAMCPRFHVDRVPCRLITTYVGAGTDWLPHHSVDRSKLGAGSGGLSDEESGLFPPAQAVQTLSAGSVGLLKGELWEGNEGAGLVHRSPASAGPRLLLTLDFASADE